MPKMFAPPGLTHMTDAIGRPVHINRDGSTEVEHQHIIARLEQGFTFEAAVLEDGEQPVVEEAVEQVVEDGISIPDVLVVNETSKPTPVTSDSKPKRGFFGRRK